MQRILSYRPDFLIWMIIIAVVVALVLPVRGAAVEPANWVVTIAIGFLFFLYGVRLSPREALQGLTHWRLHVLIVCLTFVFFPLVGLALMVLKPIVGAGLYLGILYLTLVPSTVQSSVTFTSIAHGHIAASVVAASVSSLLGVFVTPLLAMLLLAPSGGVHIDGSTFIKIGVQLLLPFVLGQLLRRWVLPFAANKLTKKFDQISIGLVVYTSFSEAVTSGTFGQVSWVMLVGLVIGSCLLVYAMLAITSWVSRRLGFNYRDQVAIQFAGTKKSLAAGLPMAAGMFGSAGAGAAAGAGAEAAAGLGLIILPLMIFHQVQLVICSIRASTYAERWGEKPGPEAHTW